jgi:hypothetical protein
MSDNLRNKSEFIKGKTTCWKHGCRLSGIGHGSTDLLNFESRKVMKAFRGSEFKGSGFSPAAGQKNGRSNRKRNFKKANIES